MKFSWGTGIVIAIVIFMVITVATVIFMMNQDVDLVSDDYYEKGIKHQEKIDLIDRSNKLDVPVKIQFDGSFVLISFPETIWNESINGEIFFYRPSDAEKDFKLPLSLTNGSHIIPVKGLKKGFWRVQLNWNLNEKESYYSETSFILE
jgi:hypothetical protein